MRPGTFWMSEGDHNKQRQVEIVHDFYIGAFPVTQGEWRALMGKNPSEFRRKRELEHGLHAISARDLRLFPVECVSWEDVQRFLERLNARESGKGLMYRLPTEVEWEYACRVRPDL